MATIEVSTADELITALTQKITEATTIQLTTDIDMNDYILTSAISINTTETITVTGLHDTNQRYAIKNIQTSGVISIFSVPTTIEHALIFEYISFTNMYCLGATLFASRAIFNHCDIYGTFKLNTGFAIATTYNKYTTMNYCSITFDNSTLWGMGFAGTNLNYCFVKYKQCKMTAAVSDNSIDNTFFTGDITINVTPAFDIAPSFCIFNITLTTTQSSFAYCNTPTYICLQNSTLASGVTLSTGNTLVSLTDNQMKNFDDVYATGFPVVNYTES